MAVRPVFTCTKDVKGYFIVKELSVEFGWCSGFSLAQKQRSIASLHAAALAGGNCKSILEISSKSASHLGVSLSAFNLSMQLPSCGLEPVSVETLYQGAKEFDDHKRTDNDRFLLSAREARSRVKEVQNNSRLSGWSIDNLYFDLSSGTSFYDWLYLKALTQNPLLLKEMLDYDSFTDIEFNPRNSLACQARSAAVAKAAILQYGSLTEMLDRLLKSSAFCLGTSSGQAKQEAVDCQLELDIANE